MITERKKEGRPIKGKEIERGKRPWSFCLSP